ncbi:site-specific integrase [soil metagenome]
MATVTQIGEKYRVQVRRAGHKSTSKTFATMREAQAWARKVESAMDDHKQTQPTEYTVANLIERYRRMRVELGRPVDPKSSGSYMLDHLSEDLGIERIEDLTPQRFASWARMRAEQGAGGYTINMELSQLGTVLRHTASFLRVVFPDVVGSARPLLHYAQLIGGGERRTRKASPDELTALLEWLDLREPIVADAVRVAAITGMRRGEIARIGWADLDDIQRAVLVRQRKHPRRIEARDEWVPLLGDAWAIVDRQARTGERIFPVSREKLTDTVTAATRALGIPDLRLHDMRRTANSGLRDMGFDDLERMRVLGHTSRAMNDRYIGITLDELHQKHAASQGNPPRPARPRKASVHPIAAKKIRP